MVTTRLLTAQDLWNLGDSAEHCELIDGELESVAPPGGEHSFIQANLSSILLQHVRAHKLGRVFGEIGFVLRRDPDTVLGPDISFVATQRLPADQTRFLELAPDLAVEIVSPSNAQWEVHRKLAIYLSTGVKSVWIVYPKQRRVVVHAPDQPPQTFKDGETMTGGEVLSGLSLTVSEIFDA